MSMPSGPRSRGETLVLPRRWIAPAVVIAALSGAASVPAAAGAASAVQVSPKPITTALTTKATKTTVAVRNTGKRRLSGLTLTVRPPKGVEVTMSGAKRGQTRRALKALKARGSTRVVLRLRRTKAGPTAGRLTVKVTRKGKTVATGRLPFGKTTPPTPPTPAPAPAPAPAPPPLAGRYFWTSQYSLNGTIQKSLYFTGPQLVHVEENTEAFATCPAASEACLPYAYDPAAGQVAINGAPGTLQGRALVLGGDTFLEIGAPPAGTRWDTVVTYANSSGLCPMYCSYYREDLTFRSDGTFIRGAVSSGTGGGGDWAVIPDDSKGFYEVRADRTLRLAFADGKERIETVGQYMNDDGSLQAVGEGLILGGDGYFDIRD